MTSRKCLAVFLILLLFFPLVPLVYAGGPDAPVREHPWEEVKKGFPPPKKHVRHELLEVDEICPYFTGSPIYYPSVLRLVINKDLLEEIKIGCSAITRSLPRKK